ncbi:MAG: DUF5615 family PIN-like protein [Acidobacteria bacterium]|nr:DUF5615 family PIN-like protein [Acidobacteriota bacterium]
MKFLVDAQLPRRLANKLREFGHESLHTLDLPNGNIRNAELEALFLTKLQQLEANFANCDFIEIDLLNVIVHI